MKHPRAWTQSEESILRELWGSDLKPIAIAPRLGRTVNAVCDRAAVLGLPTKKPGHGGAYGYLRRNTSSMVDDVHEFTMLSGEV